MDFIGSLGAHRVSFEGVGVITNPRGETQEANFQVVQHPDGRILLGLRGSAPFVDDDVQRFEGTTLSSPGAQIVSADGLLQVRSTTLVNRFLGSQALFSCRSLSIDDPERIRLVDALSERGLEAEFPPLEEVRVVLVNYFGSATRLDLGSVRASLAPVEHFGQAKEAFRVVGGVFHSHEVTLRGPLPGPEVDELLESLCLALSLETGTRVNYYSRTYVYEGGYRQTLLREPVLRRKAWLPSSLGVLTEAQPVVDALIGGRLDMGRRAINQFVEACNEETFLEARGLNAVSLIDSVLQAMDRTSSSSPRLPRSKQDLLSKRARQAAVEALRDLGLRDEDRIIVRQNLTDNIVGITETSFRRKLTFHLQREGIVTSGAQLDALVTPVTQTRNALVHAGSFKADDDNRYQEYLRLVWVAAGLTARWVGDRSGFGTCPPHLLP